VKLRADFNAISRINAPVEGKANPLFPHIHNFSLLKDTN
jgi:hypothetical protein